MQDQNLESSTFHGSGVSISLTTECSLRCAAASSSDALHMSLCSRDQYSTSPFAILRYTPHFEHWMITSLSCGSDRLRRAASLFSFFVITGSGSLALLPTGGGTYRIILSASLRAFISSFLSLAQNSSVSFFVGRQSCDALVLGCCPWACSGTGSRPGCCP